LKPVQVERLAGLAQGKQLPEFGPLFLLAILDLLKILAALLD
jgi:hypothetical protein